MARAEFPTGVRRLTLSLSTNPTYQSLWAGLYVQGIHTALACASAQSDDDGRPWVYDDETLIIGRTHFHVVPKYMAAIVTWLREQGIDVRDQRKPAEAGVH